MDADTLVKKAQQSIKNKDYDTAREYLREAAGMAPLRSDIREMLEFVIQRQRSSRPAERAPRQPSQPEPKRDRGRDRNRAAEPAESSRGFSPREFAPDEQSREEERRRPPELPRRPAVRNPEEPPRSTERERPQRALFQTERERARAERSSEASFERNRPSVFSSAAPPKRHSFLVMFVTFALIALVVAGGVTIFILKRPDVVKFPQFDGGTVDTGATTATAPAATAQPADPNDPTQALAAATSLVSQSNYEGAAQTIQRSLDAHPEEKENLSKHLGEIYFAWGKDLYRESKLDQSLEKLRSAAKSDPQNAQILHWIGEAYLLRARSSGGPLKNREGDFQEAEKALKEAIQLDANIIKSYYTLGKTYAAKEQPDKAAEYYNEVIRRAPDSPEAERARRDLRMMDMKTP